MALVIYNCDYYGVITALEAYPSRAVKSIDLEGFNAM